MDKPIDNLTLLELQENLNNEDTFDPDVISLYDVKTLVNTKYNIIENKRKEYNKKCKYIVGSKINTDSNIIIHGFDFEKNQLRISFKRDMWDNYKEISLSKKNDDLYVSETSDSTYNEEILLHLGDVLSELYDIYIDFTDFFIQDSKNIKPFNSKFKVDIDNSGIKVFTSYLDFQIKDDFSLRWSNEFSKYNYLCNSNNILNEINGKEDELFKKIFVKIEDCSKWMQKQLYETRKIELLSKDKIIKKEPKKKDNYELLMDEIKEFLTKDEIDSSSTLIEIVSLYDLYNLLKLGLEDLEKIYINSKLEKELKKFNIKRNFLSIKPYFSGVFLESMKQKSSICLDLHGRSIENLAIMKDKGNDHIYFNCNESKENKYLFNFVRKNYDLIMETLEILEEYHDLIGKLPKEMALENKLFDIKLKINESGCLIFEIGINKNHKFYDESLKKWYDKENIIDYINRNKDEIFKRISINPYEIEESFKNIYDKAKVSQHLSKQKVKRIR